MSFIQRQPARNGRVYAELVTNRYVKETHSQKQTRQFLGVISPDTGELCLSSKIETPTEEMLRLLKQAGIPFNGLRASRRGRPRKQQSPGDYAYSATDYGELSVLLALCRAAGLDTMLLCFGLVDGTALMYAAIWLACTSEPQYLVGEWLATRDYPECLAGFDFTSPGMSRLMERTGHNAAAMHEFYRHWIAARNYPDCVVYDTTSISSYSVGLDLVERGYNRDHEKLPQVNLTMAVDIRDGMPLGYRLLPGSVPDIKSLVETAHMLMEHGLSAYMNVLDKGFFSRMNIREMLRADGLEFVMGVPVTSKQAMETLERLLPGISSSRNTVLREGEMLHVARCGWTQKTDNYGNRELSAYLVHNPERAQAQCDELERKLTALCDIAAGQSFAKGRDAEEWISENAKCLGRYLAVDANAHVAIDHDLLDAAEARAGLSLYLSSVEMKRERLVECIRGRDIVEKMYDIMKNDCGQRRLHTGSNPVMEGRMFLALLALIVRRLFAIRLEGIPGRTRPTVNEALAMLRRIKVINYNSGRRSYVEIPKHTRKLLEAIGVTLPKLGDLPPYLRQHVDKAGGASAAPQV
ncbi:MAG: transposase [Lentisphaeria bacterium]|nr:transposase [Lentisphaeria bacterium]